jgi:hypothetical protein
MVATGSAGSAKSNLCRMTADRPCWPCSASCLAINFSALSQPSRLVDLCLNLAPVAAQKLECAIETCYNVDPTFALLVRYVVSRYVVSTFDLPPLQGPPLWVAVPRVETLAESSSPFGHGPSGRGSRHCRLQVNCGLNHFQCTPPQNPTQAGSLCYISPSLGCFGFVELPAVALQTSLYTQESSVAPACVVSTE